MMRKFHLFKEDAGELKVKYLMSKSARTQVKHGDAVEVSNAPLVKFAFYLLPALLLLMFASSAFDLLNFWILGVITAVYITFILSVKPLEIKDITEEAQKQNENQNNKLENV